MRVDDRLLAAVSTTRNWNAPLRRGILEYYLHFPVENRCSIQRGRFDFKARGENEVENQKEHLNR